MEARRCLQKRGKSNYIFEGTGDLRTDVDEMVYFIPKTEEDGSMTVSTKPDKVRGKFKPITFRIASDRTVSILDTFIDVAAIKQAEARREQDSTVIEAITEALQSDAYKQTQIVDHCLEHHKVGRKPVERVLKQYCHPPNKLWSRKRAFEKNAWIYKLEGKS